MKLLLLSRPHAISFALCFGGDRFPSTTPRDAFLAAEADEATSHIEADEATSHIVYYGELGGQDEYELVELITSGKVTKPVVAYIAGVIGEGFDQPVQFGHAKALANNKSETASAKRRALAEAGVKVANSMTDFSKAIKDIPQNEKPESVDATSLVGRKASLFSSTISKESSEGYEFVGAPLQQWADEGDIALQITSALLGKRPASQKTTEFIRTVFLLSVDHGPSIICRPWPSSFRCTQYYCYGACR